jgi:hypothetical protein
MPLTGPTPEGLGAITASRTRAYMKSASSRRGAANASRQRAGSDPRAVIAADHATRWGSNTKLDKCPLAAWATVAQKVEMDRDGPGLVSTSSLGNHA